MLNEKEKKKARIIRKVISHEITRTDAAKKLNLSIRQIDRLVKRHMEQGEEGLAHKSRGKISPKKLEKEKEENAIDLYLGQYSELNFTHFYDETKDQLQMSYSSLFRVFTKDGILSTMAQKKTETDAAKIIADDMALRIGAYFHMKISNKKGPADDL